MSPQDTSIIPFSVGIAPAPSDDVVLKDTRKEKPRNRGSSVILGGGDGPVPGPNRLILPGENASVGVSREEDRQLVDVRGETLTSLTWPTYLAWRKTKCRPFNYEVSAKLAQDFRLTDHVRERSLEEIDQAVLEFIGEVGELGELFNANGPTAFFGSLRDKLIDECGDIFFCGAWVLDAWGLNPLAESDDMEMIRVTDDSVLAAFAKALAGNQPKAVLGNIKFVTLLGDLVFRLLVGSMTNASLLANSFKKLKYQRREQDVEKQVGLVAAVLVNVNQILVIANSSVEDALKANMRKLDARYPNGYQPGQGGGNRTGEGK